MDIYEQKFTNMEGEIFSYLTKHVGDVVSQRDIALALAVSPTAIANALKRMQKADIVHINPLKNIRLVSLNTNSQDILHLKRVENLRQIYTSGLAEFLTSQFAGGTIIVFGSYARGEDTSESDIDIAIIGRNQKQVSFLQYEPKLLRKIHLNIFKSWDEIPVQLKHNILNGIVIAGCVDL